MAFLIMPLADQQNHAAVLGRTLAYQVNAIAYRVQNRCSVIADIRMLESVIETAGVSRKGPRVFRFTVAFDEANLVRNVGRKVRDHRPELCIQRQLLRCGATGLQQHQQRNWLVLIFVNCNLLTYAVIHQLEVRSLKRWYDSATWATHKGWDKNEVRSRCDLRHFRRAIHRSLRMQCGLERHKQKRTHRQHRANQTNASDGLRHVTYSLSAESFLL